MPGPRLDYLAMHTVEADGCWIFTGTINNKGYGSILKTTAHRYIYEATVGPIPAGLQIDHLCMNKQCVNPAHLEPVTAAENVRRRNASETHCRRGHAFTADNTYMRAAGNKECKTCRYNRWTASLGRPVGRVGHPALPFDKPQ
jgi:hypothetical protein